MTEKMRQQERELLRAYKSRRKELESELRDVGQMITLLENRAPSSEASSRQRIYVHNRPSDMAMEKFKPGHLQYEAVLGCVKQLNEPATIEDISALTGISAPTVSSITKVLEYRGAVTRTKVSRDKKRPVLEITAK